MKLSIWRQFSSNHSNQFAIVGRFESVEAARSAADDLKTILKSVSTYYLAHPAEQDKRYEGGKYTPTPVEFGIAAHYQIDWDNFQDWTIYDIDPDVFVYTIDQYVLMNSPETGSGYNPFDKLLQSMGATVNAEKEMGEKNIFVNIRATAPEPALAHSLAITIREFLQAMYIYFLPRTSDKVAHPVPPWVFYFQPRPSASDEAILRAHDLYAAYMEEFSRLSEDYRQLMLAHLPEADLRVQAAKQTLEAHRQQSTDAFHDLAWWFIEAMFDTSPLVHGTYEKVSAEGTRLSIENLWFSSTLGSGYTALARWLHAQGCEVMTEFRLDFHPDD